MLQRFDGIDGLDEWITQLPIDETFFKCIKCDNIQTYSVSIDLEYELCNNCRQERGYLPKS